MTITDVTAKYAPSMSWFYDRFIADAVLGSMSGLIDRVRVHVGDRGSVLEVGCGGGQLASRLAAAGPGVRVTGIDLSAEQIARARARSAGPRFQVASALDLPFPDGSFDAAVSIASIKHWPDRRRGVAEMVRVLKPGGLLLVAETDRGCHLADARRFARSTRLPAPLRLPYLWAFRTYVAGQGIDLDDARELIAALSLDGAEVRRVAGTPLLAFSGCKSGLVAE